LHSLRIKDDNFEPDFVENSFLDTIAMERLSSSNFVMTIYGNCGVSQIIELGECSLHDVIKLARTHGDKLSTADKLRIAFQLASGIADVHSIDGSNVTSFAHNDLDPGQIILVDGVFKVSDFHLASIKYQDKNGRICQQHPKDLAGWVRISQVTCQSAAVCVMIHSF
jgi:serine/threonine protein kinase